VIFDESSREPRLRLDWSSDGSYQVQKILAADFDGGGQGARLKRVDRNVISRSFHRPACGLCEVPTSAGYNLSTNSEIGCLIFGWIGMVIRPRKVWSSAVQYDSKSALLID